MPGGSGVTVVTMLVCFFISHTRPRARRAPGIPCALFISRARFNNSGAIASREGEGVSGDRLRTVVPAQCAIAHWRGTHHHRIALRRESRRPACLKTAAYGFPGVRRDDVVTEPKRDP